MIYLTLTDREALKLRELLERKQRNKDPDLARIHHKVHRLLQRPAVNPPKRKDPPFNPFGWDPPEGLE